ncbi:MAG: MOSC domain-containing protein [Acidimicrobiales bacterium]
MLKEIWRYPLKSSGGELVSETDVQANGLAGDRFWAVVDSQTGLVASAKRPGMWGALLTTSASLNGPDLRVTLPDGQTASSIDSEALDALISALVGRPVSVQVAQSIEDPTLERTDPNADLLMEDGDLVLGDVATGALSAAAPNGTVFDFAPIHIVSTATLEALETHTASAGDPRRFRPNLVIDIDGPAFQENEWPGQKLSLGTNLELEVFMASPRCVVPSLAQTGLPRSVSTLRTVAALNRIELEGLGVSSCVGAYARVKQPGTIAVGAHTSLS